MSPERHGRLAEAFAAVVVKLRFVVLAGWVAAAAAAYLLLPSLEEGPGSLGSLIPEDAEPLAVEARANELFTIPMFSRVAAVQRDPDGLSVEAQAEAFARAAKGTLAGFPEHPAVLGALPVTNTLGLFPGSAERSTTVVTYLFVDPDLGLRRQEAAARRFAEAEIGDDPDAGYVGITGSLPARETQGRLIDQALPFVEGFTVLAIVLIVAIHFRSVGAPLVVLAAVAISYLGALRLMPLVAERLRITIPDDIRPVVVALLLGVMTDYSIFFLSGMRERLAAGESRLDAARATTARFAPIVFMAGLIVAAASVALLVASIEFFRAFGPGLALTVLLALAVAMTFVPAALATFGRGVFWPRDPSRALAADSAGERDAARGWRGTVTRAITLRPVAVIVTALVAGGLIVAATQIRDLKLSISMVQELPPGTEARVASAAAASGFAAGITAPTEILVEGEDLARQRAALARLGRLIDGEPGVSGVVGPGTFPWRLLPGAFLREDGRAARLAVILEREPLSAGGIDIYRNLRARMPQLIDAAGLEGVRVGLAGDTALAAEAIRHTLRDLVRVGIMAMLVSLVLLMLFLRAVVAPLYLLAVSVLAVLASLGLATFVFQDVIGAGGLTYYVPFVVAVLLVSLGSDYNVFLVGRVWEEGRRRSLREAVRTAAPRASRAITIAGLVLAASFGLLAIVPLLPFRQFAFAMVAGILIDAFVVRSLLVPALMSLFGPASTWPGRLRSRVRPARAA